MLIRRVVLDKIHVIERLIEQEMERSVISDSSSNNNSGNSNSSNSRSSSSSSSNNTNVEEALTEMGMGRLQID